MSLRTFQVIFMVLISKNGRLRLPDKTTMNRNEVSRIVSCWNTSIWKNIYFSFNFSYAFVLSLSSDFFQTWNISCFISQKSRVLNLWRQHKMYLSFLCMDLYAWFFFNVRNQKLIRSFCKGKEKKQFMSISENQIIHSVNCHRIIMCFFKENRDYFPVVSVIKFEKMEPACNRHLPEVRKNMGLLKVL